MNLDAFRKTYPVTRFTIAGSMAEMVRTGGRQSPAILLPGAQGTAEIFFKQLTVLGAQRDVVAVTYPAWTDAAALADFVVLLADKLGFARFDLVGSSFGGHVAQWMAAYHPDRIRKLVVGNSFADPAPLQSPERLAAVRDKEADTLKAEAMGRLEASPAGELRDVLLDLVGHHQPADLLKSRMLGVQMAKPVPQLALPEDRILLIECDNDPLVSPPVREAMRRHYAGARCETISDGGHYPYLVKAAEYNAAISRFLS